MVLNFRPEYSLSPDSAFPANRSRQPSLASSESASFSSTPASSPFHPRKSCTSSLAGSDTPKDYDPYSVEKYFPSVLSSGQNSEADQSGTTPPSSIPASPSVVSGQRIVVAMILLNQDGCAQNVKEAISKIIGVQAVTIDGPKDLLTVKETTEFAPCYNIQRVNRHAKVAPTRKNIGAAAKRERGRRGNYKKEKEAHPAADQESRGGDAGGRKIEVTNDHGSGSGGGERKEGNGCGGGSGESKEGGGSSSGGGGGSGDGRSCGGTAATVVNQMNYYGYSNRRPPMMWYDGQVHGQNWPGEYPPLYGHVSTGYSNTEGFLQYYRPNLHAPQLFSDENPNACSIM